MNVKQNMAGFVTANRWATGVETHKTSEGRILCTGIGCVGCYPDVFAADANELGVCDVDLTAGILGLRSFLDEGGSQYDLKRNANNFSKKQKKVKIREKRPGRTTHEGRVCFERATINQEADCNMPRSRPVDRKGPTELHTVATQTEFPDFGIDKHTEPVPVEKMKDPCIKDKLTSVEERKAVYSEGTRSGDRTGHTGDDKVIPLNVNTTVNKTTQNLETLFNQRLSGSGRIKIFDELFMVNRKDKSLSSYINRRNLPFCKSVFLAQDSHAFGEDAVCFFFALEYYNSRRILPHFRIMEIVEALSTRVDLEDIKCVQRISHRWHIVLKSRKYNTLLRNSGLMLRGRIYQLVDDVDGYFDVVY